MNQKNIMILAIGLAIVIAGGVIWQLPPEEGDFKGSTSVGLTIVYEDGTERIFDATKKPFASFMPLKISDTGGEVASLKVQVKVKPTFTGEYTSTSLESSWLTMVISSPTGGSDINFKSYSDTAFSTPTFTSGEWATILTKSFTASSIETSCGTYNVYSMTINCGVYLTMGFGASENTKSATGTSIWAFKYEADEVIPTGVLSSISVSLSRSALR